MFQSPIAPRSAAPKRAAASSPFSQLAAASTACDVAASATRPRLFSPAHCRTRSRRSTTVAIANASASNIAAAAATRQPRIVSVVARPTAKRTKTLSPPPPPLVASQTTTTKLAARVDFDEHAIATADNPEANTDDWSEAEMALLLSAYASISPTCVGFWSHVALRVASRSATVCQRKYESQFERQIGGCGSASLHNTDEADAYRTDSTIASAVATTAACAQDRLDCFQAAAPKQKGRIVAAFIARQHQMQQNLAVAQRSDDLFKDAPALLGADAPLDALPCDATWLDGSNLLGTLVSPPHASIRGRENTQQQPRAQLLSSSPPSSSTSSMSLQQQHFTHLTFDSLVASPASSMYRHFEQDQTNALISKIHKKHLDSHDGSVAWRRPAAIVGVGRAKRTHAGPESRATKLLSNALKQLTLRDCALREQRIENEDARLEQFADTVSFSNALAASDECTLSTEDEDISFSV